MSRLIQLARRFVSDIRKSPAAATGRNLEDFEAAISRADAFDGTHMALVAPLAPYSWQSREVLTIAEDETRGADLDVGERIQVVGALITLLSVDDDNARPLPPLEAFDVRIALNKKDVFTAKMDSRQSGTREQFANAPSLNVLTPRLWGLMIDGAPQPTVSIQYRWAVDSATRTIRNWADTQITTVLFVHRLEGT